MQIGIPYEDDDYREENDDDRPNDIRDARPYDYHGGRFNQLHDMTRQTHFDVGGGRDPPTIPSLYDAYRGYGIQKPGIQSYNPQASLQPQHPTLQSQPQPQPQSQPQAAPLAAAPGSGGQYDGVRANAFGYNPYGQYAYNPYGYRYPYGWNRPAPATQPTNPWNPFSIGFPFNLFGLGGGGGGGGGGSARPWWNSNRWGLFF